MIGNQKYVTIATDAGVWTQHQLSVWACYIVSPVGVIQHAEAFKEYEPVSARAERKALCNALHIADRQLNLAEHKVIIYCEIEHVLNYSLTKAGNVRKRGLEDSYIIDQCLEILGRSQGYELRHVKAHTNQTKARKEGKGELPAKYKLNRWCDQECTRVGRRIIKFKKQAQAAINTEAV